MIVIPTTKQIILLNDLNVIKNGYVPNPKPLKSIVKCMSPCIATTLFAFFHLLTYYCSFIETYYAYFKWYNIISCKICFLVRRNIIGFRNIVFTLL